MTEKIARRGVRVPSDYAADYLDRILVRDACAREVVTLPAGQTLEATRAWLEVGGAIAQHQGFPVVDAQGALRGVVTRRDLLDRQIAGDRTVGELVKRPALAVREDHSLREAADHMVEANVGRLIVLGADGGHRMKMKNLLNSAGAEVVFKADDKMDQIVLDKRDCTYSYFADPMYVFMRTSSRSTPSRSTRASRWWTRKAPCAAWSRAATCSIVR